MRKILLTAVASAVSLLAMAQAPAFPGAEGVARWTTSGGRGGKVIHVTNLRDSGAGSLRAACEASGKRIVVFDVSGTIELSRQLKISNANITILGQTAPGDGICLKNFTFNVSANNVIIRFIRCRMGDEKKTEDDAMNGYFHTGEQKSNVIIDHCSMSWCTDECASFYGIENFTLQWCTLSESLRYSVHDKGAHGYGGIWGGKNAAFHHNLLAHHDSRNPRFDHDYVNTMKGPWDYVNNVVYNWGGNSTYGGESANENNDYKKLNMLNNYYKPGPATANNVKNRLAYFWTECSNCTKATGCSTIVPAHVYATGNCMHGNSTVTNDNWQGIFLQSGDKNSIKSDTRFVPAGYEGQTILTMHAAETAFDKVLAYAGASYKKDAVDQRVARETREGSFTYYGSNGSTGGLIDTQSDVGGWPEYVSHNALTDTDQDGMPDVWETANGLNPNDAADGATTTLDGKGWYTNVEVYANSLVEDLVKKQNADAQTAIDEYYPTAAKADGVEYYDESKAAEGGYPEIDGLQGNVVWPLNSNTDAEYSEAVATYLTDNTFTVGSNLAVNSYGTYGDIRFCKIKATEPQDAADDTNLVTLTFKTAEGNKFQATNIMFYACKIGTGNGNLDAAWVDGGGTSTLVTAASPSRNRQDDEGNNYYTVYNFDVSNRSTATDGTCALKLNLYNIRYAQGNNGTINYKEMGLANVVIKGVITNASGIATPVTIGSVLSTELYNAAGQRVAPDARGLLILRQRLSDGTTKVLKVNR